MASVSQNYTESVLNDLNDLSDLGRTEHAFYIERQLIHTSCESAGGDQHRCRRMDSFVLAPISGISYINIERI